MGRSVGLEVRQRRKLKQLAIKSVRFFKCKLLGCSDYGQNAHHTITQVKLSNVQVGTDGASTCR